MAAGPRKLGIHATFIELNEANARVELLTFDAENDRKLLLFLFPDSAPIPDKTALHTASNAQASLLPSLQS